MGSLTERHALTKSPVELLNTLTPLQRLYVEARMAGMNPLAAARAAGYAVPETDGYKLDKNPKIQAILKAAATTSMAKLDLKRNDVLEGLMDAVRTAATSAEMTMAWREIAKIVGAYAPQEVNVNVRNLTAEKLATMSDGALNELAGMEDFQIDDDNVIEAEYYEVEPTPDDPEKAADPESVDLSTEPTAPSPEDQALSAESEEPSTETPT